jgi:sugar lactone lactonase YvrE
MFAGPGNLVFDAKGNVWITNNVVQGQPYSTPWSIVLDATGRPARNAKGDRMSPFTGSGLLGPGWGIALDKKGQVWIGDYGWGNVNPPGSVSVFNSDAQPVAPNGFQAGVYRVQGVAVDDADNVWLASHGNGQVVVYPGGDAGAAIIYSGDPDSFLPFSISIAEDGSAWVTNSGPQSGVTQLRLHNGKLECLRDITIGSTNRGLAIDSDGNIWVASSGNDHVYALDREGAFIGGYQGGGIGGPWGVTLDGDDNLWVGNLGPLEVGSVFNGRLTQLAGARANNGHRMGDALSPQTGYTVPSAGSQVLLHDGTPLYGKDGPPCFTPMMRTTAVNIDAAGNVWTCNNWKPSFDNNAFGDPVAGKPANPGGDGLMIFVGLAKPL